MGAALAWEATMSRILTILLAAPLAFASLATSAAERNPVTADPDRDARIAEARTRQALMLRRGEAPAPQAAAAGVKAAPLVNPVRAYPPSCLADPLPTTASGPTYSNGNVELAATDGAGNFYRERVTITIWRVVCSSSEFYTSATLMRIARQSQYEGDTEIYPLFPATDVAQGSIGIGDSPRTLIRVATEPNTIISDVPVDSPIVYSTTYVLENYPYEGATEFDFNLGFDIRFDNQFSSGTRFYAINGVPTYNPTASTYPEAFLDLPVSGYLSTNWFDPTKPGEGLVIQIYEIHGTNDLVFAHSWSTFDAQGVPFWFFGQAVVNRSTRSISAPMSYLTGGGFAGSGGAVSAAQPWGTTTFRWPDCNTLILGFTANPGLPAGVPSGSGTREWKRVGAVNNLACE